MQGAWPLFGWSSSCQLRLSSGQPQLLRCHLRLSTHQVCAMVCADSPRPRAPLAASLAAAVRADGSRPHAQPGARGVGHSQDPLPALTVCLSCLVFGAGVSQAAKAQRVLEVEPLNWLGLCAALWSVLVVRCYHVPRQLMINFS